MIVGVPKHLTCTVRFDVPLSDLMLPPSPHHKQMSKPYFGSMEFVELLFGFWKLPKQKLKDVTPKEIIHISEMVN